MASPTGKVSAPIAEWLVPLGLFLLLIGLVDGAVHWIGLHRLLKTQARISEIRQTETSAGDIVQTVHVVFLVPGSAQEIIDFVPHPGVFSAVLVPGNSVLIAYPRNNPQAAKLATTSSAYGVSIAFTLTGMALFDAGWFAAYQFRNRARHRTFADWWFKRPRPPAA
jgi:hypothetical protein